MHPDIARSGNLTGPVPSSGAITPDESAALLRAVFNLFKRWRLNADECRNLLGQPGERILARWEQGETGDLPHDTICRLTDLMGIHKALRYLFTEPDRCYAWVRKPNLAFGGRSALDRMLAGAPSDLSAVRAYLDAERGGW